MNRRFHIWGAIKTFFHQYMSTYFSLMLVGYRYYDGIDLLDYS
jgi:hypothetical protein